ncbi:MAG: molybdopterin molybdotransferase MoeA, partial [Proteobacteria bacterium]|nr:molybdopterin molybdotransferase MoeA [Pseudomonadota bacterium]
MRTGLAVAEALEAILSETPVLPPETTNTQDALGRVLAEPVTSTRTLPPADCSAMDGYAVRAADLAGADREHPVELPVVGEIPAGADPDGPSLAPGQAARIFTGAPVPPGADTVVRQEDTDAVGDRVRILIAPSIGEHVREAGEDVRAGQEILAPGRRLGPAELGMLASLGRSVVAVHQRPSVAILSGGDELVEPDRDPAGGRIVSANSYTLSAQCREVGADPVYLGIARAPPEDLERHLRAGLSADV